MKLESNVAARRVVLQCREPNKTKNKLQQISGLQVGRVEQVSNVSMNCSDVQNQT
jgi:hypothetical protein